MSKYLFTPAMILAAAGSYASAAGATVMTQTFDLAYDPSNTQDITIGGALTPQYTLTSIPEEFENNPDGSLKFDIPPSRGLNASPGSYTGNFVGSAIIPLNGDSVTGSSAKVTAGSDDQYLQLAFEIDGQSAFGVADFGQDMTLKTISYEVRGPAAVPEPAVWMELILGFGLAGSAQRAARRRRQPAVAAL